MSTYGSYDLRLRQQRQQELQHRREEQRKQKVRQEAVSLIAEGRQAVRQSSNHLTQHFGREAQQQAQEQAQQAEKLLQSDPDKALKLVRKSRATAERGMAQASGQAAEWTEEKIAAQEAVTVFELGLQSILNDSDSNDNKELKTIAKQLAEAKTALRREDFATAKKLAAAGQKQVGQIEQARQQQQQQEDQRREIVHGLRGVLTGMGFVVEDPVMGQDREEQKVVLVGNMPSGRTARFAVSLDGRVDYDFDGYRSYDACGKDREQLRLQLEEHIQAKSSNHDMHWKGEGPRRIDKDALDLPSGKQRDWLI